MRTREEILDELRRKAEGRTSLTNLIGFAILEICFDIRELLQERKDNL